MQNSLQVHDKLSSVCNNNPNDKNVIKLKSHHTLIKKEF